MLINQLIHEIYGDDLENILEKDNQNEDGFRFSTAKFEDHGFFNKFNK